jgi:hypothetical protein
MRRSSARAHGASTASALATALAAALLLAGCVPLDVGREATRDDAPTPVASPTPTETPAPVFTNPAGVEVPEPGVLVSQGGDVRGTVSMTTTAGVTLVDFAGLVVHGGGDDVRVRVAAGDVVRNPDGFWWVDANGSIDLGRLRVAEDGSARAALPEDVRPDNIRSVTIWDRGSGVALGSAQLKP